jgi:hypothetical protein
MAAVHAPLLVKPAVQAAVLCAFLGLFLLSCAAVPRISRWASSAILLEITGQRLRSVVGTPQVGKDCGSGAEIARPWVLAEVLSRRLPCRVTRSCSPITAMCMSTSEWGRRCCWWFATSTCLARLEMWTQSAPSQAAVTAPFSTRLPFHPCLPITHVDCKTSPMGNVLKCGPHWMRSGEPTHCKRGPILQAGSCISVSDML